MEKLTQYQFDKCKEDFLALGERALTMNHYQLALETNVENPTIWRAFLLDPKVADYINSEMNIIRAASINEIVQNAPNSKSVGQAQLVNALLRINETAENKEGPVFIYTYVPLNEEQKFAPNVMDPLASVEPEKVEEEIEEEPETTETIEPELEQETDEGQDEYTINEDYLKSALVSIKGR